ncbi:MAG: hypothetical protein ACRCWJ_13935 [Casimicrobium sp.]
MYIYEPAARALSQQAQAFVNQGTMTSREAASWLNAQRNALVVSTRDRLNSPLGRAIAEYLKPRDKMPQLPDLERKIQARSPHLSGDQMYEAIIKSGAGTRASVNLLAVTLKFAGPTLVGVNIVYSGYIVMQAPPQQRGQVASREVGAIVGGVGGGWFGAKAGCAGGAAIGVWFVGWGSIPGCFIGGIGGAFGGGWAGSHVGGMAGEALWSAANTVVDWK